ncbi:MAG TPA: DPP IV N-terminal domain-containing protein, partial [Pyrinomonadaceae bacterium]
MDITKLPKLAMLAASLFTTISVVAQQRAADAPRTLTAADYARAEKLLAYNTAPLVFRSGVRPSWLPGDRFWYRVTTSDGSEFLLVDPAKGTREAAFDHAKVAAALSAAAGTTYDARHLPFTQFDFSADERAISFTVQRRRWKCDLPTNQCTAEGSADPGSAAPGGGRARALEVLSPDKKRAAFIRDFNLWVRDVAGGKETQLTTDGVKDFGYATDNAGWVHSDRAILLWSPDSKKIATF